MDQFLQQVLTVDTTVKLVTGGAIGALITAFINWWRERRSVYVALEAEIERVCEAIGGQLTFIRETPEGGVRAHAQGVPWLPFNTPVWDGMVVAQGKIYMATVNGKIMCFGKPKK